MSILELISSGSQDGEKENFQATIDIVAVHGLYEGAEETWTDPHSGTLWLRDLFPYRAQNARILAYSYPAQKLISSEGASSPHLLPFATNLIAELAAYRWHADGMKRPIIFIGHGFGGLLIKKALVHASAHRSREMDCSIYVSTFAILFMGTPHRGMEQSFLSATKDSTLNVNQRFWSGLSRDSAFLSEITDQFAPLMKRFCIFNLWEEAMTTIGNVKTFVVHEDSAAPAWGNDERCGVQSTHSGMVKFKSTLDSGYRVVHAALIRYQRDALSLIESRWEDELALLSAELEQRASEFTMQDRHGKEAAQKPSVGCGATKHQEYVVPHASTNLFVARHVHSKRAQACIGVVDPGPTWRKPRVLVICGLGGCGKTQFALRYAEDSRLKYWGVFWADASSTETLQSSLASLAITFGKGSTSSSAIYWLSTCLKPWLLIFDNADDPDMDLSLYLPPGGNGDILITTRNPGANVYATMGCMKLSGMDPEEAVTLLLRSAFPEPGINIDDPKRRELAHAIAERLGYLPIALAQAGATIAKKIYPLEVYLHHYLGHQRSIIRQRNDYSSVYAETITTWEIPFQKIATNKSIASQDAVELVHIFAFLHFESIPERLFRRSWHDFHDNPSAQRHYPRFLQAHESWDEDAHARFRYAVRTLYEHSLIDHDSDNETFNDLAKVFCERQKALQAVDILEAILPVVERTLGEKHVGMTMTRSNLARAYVLCQRWDEAECLLSGLIDNIPREHPDSVNTRSGLVHVRIRMGKLSPAERDCLALIDEIEHNKTNGPASPRALAIYEQLLEIYRLQNRKPDLQALLAKMPAIQPPTPTRRFDMFPVQRISRTESELGRLIG
ncbi:hypothetical protein KCU88_g2950, partial [Aureobasidium melanogenum]